MGRVGEVLHARAYTCVRIALFAAGCTHLRAGASAVHETRVFEASSQVFVVLSFSTFGQILLQLKGKGLTACDRQFAERAGARW